MTSSLHYPLVCGRCGREGTLRCQENDAPFSTQWESWTVTPFRDTAGTAGEPTVGCINLAPAEALRRMVAACDACRSLDIRLVRDV